MEKIAIIGMSCRFPGGANSLEEFWNLLISKKDAIVEVPKNRWDTRKFFSKFENKPNKAYVKEGGFLNTSVFGFDPLFFGITPREAECMDPQQRMLLQITWEAMEDSGLTIKTLQNLQTGVFVGCFTLDNKLDQLSNLNLRVADSNTPTSSTMAIVANRISYIFNLQGPSIAIDTACSSSLVSTHLACQSILTGESDIAIAAGVNIITRPEYPIVMSKGHFLSKHGRCKTFDIDAGGYTRGEGVGVVLLKPYEKALADGDRIYSIISATGVNQDGATIGMASPNPDAQEKLIRTVYKKANVTPNDIQYIEAHGTGTQAGDLAETKALGRIFSNKTNGKIIVGSVKTNIGHLEAAAGIAGLIKTSLCLYNKKLVPNLHFNNPNPKIDFEKENLEVIVENKWWPFLKNNSPMRASINSFGYGGTNAHALLENHTENVTQNLNNLNSNKKYLINISAHNKKALKEVSNKLLERIKSNDILNLSSLSYNLLYRRSVLPENFSFWSDSLEETAQTLQAISKDEKPQKGIQENFTRTKLSKLAFVMTGMGPQWQGMGKDLYQSNFVFRKKIDECDLLFKKISGWSLLEELLKDEAESRMNEASIAQPANFFVQVGIFEIFKEFGIKPDALVGHSVGEVSAAYCSGMLSLEDALSVSYYRSKLQQTLAGKGTMLALGVGEKIAQEIIKDVKNVDIAAINASSTVTLAGDFESLKKIEKYANEKNIFAKFLAVDIAYHSYQMDEINKDILMSLKHIKPKECLINLYSTVTSGIADKKWDNDYWWQNVRSPVFFEKTIKQMIQDGYDHFIEVGPHPVLKTSLEGTFQELNVKAYRTHTLNRKENEIQAIENSVAWMFSHGFELNNKNSFEDRSFIDLPLYPWQNEEYKRETEESKKFLRGTDGNVFLYHKNNDALHSWEVEVTDGFFPFLEDHKVQNNVVFPGAGYIEAGLAIANEIKKEDQYFVIEDINFSNMLVTENDYIQVLKTNYNNDNRFFTVQSRKDSSGEEWRQHAKGKIFFYDKKQFVSKDLSTAKQNCDSEINIEELYQKMVSVGLCYGPYFKGINKLIKSKTIVLSKIKGDHQLAWDDKFLVQPALLDACFQSLIGFLDLNSVSASFVPVKIDEVQYFSKPGLEFNCLVELSTISNKEIVGDISLLNDFGEVSLYLKGVRCKAIYQKQEDVPISNNRYEISFERLPVLTHSVPSGKTIHLVSEINDEKIQKENWTNYFESVEFFSFEELFKVNPKIENLVVVLNNNVTDITLSFSNIRKVLNLNEHNLKSLYLITKNACFIPNVDLAVNCELGALGSLAQVIANEYPTIICKNIDVDDNFSIKDIISEILNDENINEVAIRGSFKYIPKLVNVEQEKESAKFTLLNAHADVHSLQISKPGSINNLEYIKLPVVPLNSNQVKIKTLTASLNFKDLLKVYGQISNDVIRDTFFGDTIGMEFCGEIIQVGKDVKDFKVGEKVIGAYPGAFTTFLTMETDYLMKLPKNMEVTKAPVLIAFITSYYGLHKIAKLSKGEKVLIHNATGGVGLAAIQVAKWLGAEIYATAGTDVKVAYLKELGIKHIYNSRSIDFYNEINNDTKGYGVDVVLNALSGPALEKSFQLLAPYGRFIEIGKKDIAENSGLTMKPFNEGLLFASLDIDRMFENKKQTLKLICNEIFEKFEANIFSPIPVKVFPSKSTKDAFTFMAQSKHVGKIVIDYQNEFVEVKDTSKPLANKKGLVLVTGGTSGFGFEITKSLALDTDYSVVALSRNGFKNNKELEEFNQLVSRGSKIYFEKVDISSTENVFELLPNLERKFGELKGIVHSAVVLEDCFIKDLDAVRMNSVLDAKVNGAKNLSEYCLKFNSKLDFFVSFSSISSVIGNPGQANYVIANRYLDLMTHNLRQKGVNAFTINWGVLGESGLLSRNITISNLLKSYGIIPLTNKTAIDNFYKIISGSAPQVGIFEVDWKKWSTAFKNLSKSKKFSKLTNSSNNNTNPLKIDFINKLQTMSKDDSFQFVVDKIKESLSLILKLSVDKIDTKVGINNFGVDSLMAVEVLILIEKNLFVELTTVELLNGPSVDKLAKITLEKLLVV